MNRLPRRRWTMALLGVLAAGIGMLAAHRPVRVAWHSWRLESEVAGERVRSATVLGRLRAVSAVEGLVERLADEDESVRQAAVEALVAIGRPALPALRERFTDEREDVVRLAVGSHLDIQPLDPILPGAPPPDLTPPEEGVPPPATVPGDPVTLRLHVRDALRDEPLEDAEIRLEALDLQDFPVRRYAQTDEDGNGEISLPSPDIWLVRVLGEGFVTENVEVDLGIPDNDDLQVFLTPGCTVSGKVVDQDGKPVEGAVVRVETNDFYHYWRNYPWSSLPRPDLESNSRKDGGFQISGVPTGTEYRVLCVHPLHDNGQFPPLPLRFREHRSGVVLTVKRRELHKVVEGLVRDQSGRPVGGGYVEIRVDEHSSTDEPMSPAPGSVQLARARVSPDGLFQVASLRQDWGRLQYYTGGREISLKISVPDRNGDLPLLGQFEAAPPPRPPTPFELAPIRAKPSENIPDDSTTRLLIRCDSWAEHSAACRPKRYLVVRFHDGPIPKENPWEIDWLGRAARLETFASHPAWIARPEYKQPRKADSLWARVEFSGTGLASSHFDMRLDVGEINEFHIPWSPGRSVSGVVRAPDGKPVPGALVILNEAGEPTNRLQPVDRQDTNADLGWFFTDEDGRFTVTGLEEYTGGRTFQEKGYCLWVDVPGHAYTRARPFRVVSGHTLTDLEIVLQREAIIDARVMGWDDPRGRQFFANGRYNSSTGSGLGLSDNSPPAPGTFVRPLSEAIAAQNIMLSCRRIEPVTGYYHVMEVRRNGTFEIRGLMPGAYHVRWWLEAWSELQNTATFETIDLQAGERKSLLLDPAQTLDGIPETHPEVELQVFRDGNPWPNVHASWTWPSRLPRLGAMGFGDDRPPVTDTQGRQLMDDYDWRGDGITGLNLTWRGEDYLYDYHRLMDTHPSVNERFVVRFGEASISGNILYRVRSRRTSENEAPQSKHSPGSDQQGTSGLEGAWHGGLQLFRVLSGGHARKVATRYVGQMLFDNVLPESTIPFTFSGLSAGEYLLRFPSFGSPKNDERLGLVGEPRYVHVGENEDLDNLQVVIEPQMGAHGLEIELTGPPRFPPHTLETRVVSPRGQEVHNQSQFERRNAGRIILEELPQGAVIGYLKPERWSWGPTVPSVWFRTEVPSPAPLRIERTWGGDLFVHVEDSEGRRFRRAWVDVRPVFPREAPIPEWEFEYRWRADPYNSSGIDLVTRSEGLVAIPGLPLGTYRVEAWNGEARSDVAFVEIREEETTLVTLTMAPRDA